MTRWHAAAVVAAAGLLGIAGPAPGRASADAEPPQLGAACTQDAVDAMTLLPDQRTYAVCTGSVSNAVWAEVQTPFDPNDTWLTYGPPITLHGQAMRNPNLTSGRWTATPQDPETVCRAEQQTVVEAGVLAAPEVSEGRPGQPLSVAMLPKLFYATLSGNCLWARD